MCKVDCIEKDIPSPPSYEMMIYFEVREMLLVIIVPNRIVHGAEETEKELNEEN